MMKREAANAKKDVNPENKNSDDEITRRKFPNEETGDVLFDRCKNGIGTGKEYANSDK